MLRTVWAHHPAHCLGTSAVPPAAAAGFLKADLVRKNLSNNDMTMLKDSTTHVGGSGFLYDVWHVDWVAVSVQLCSEYYTWRYCWVCTGEYTNPFLSYLHMLAVDVHGRQQSSVLVQRPRASSGKDHMLPHTENMFYRCVSYASTLTLTH